jgi:hypothetical protein
MGLVPNIWSFRAPGTFLSYGNKIGFLLALVQMNQSFVAQKVDKSEELRVWGNKGL